MSEAPTTHDKQFKETAILYAATEESGSHLREQLLSDFAHDPNDDTVWETAYAKAQHEEDEGGNEYSELKGISTAELIQLSKKVRAMSDFRDRYALMSEQSPNGELWYDALTGFSSPDLEVAMDTFLIRKVQESEKQALPVGVDLGCATGRIAEVLSRHCDKTVGIDASEELLRIADQRSGERIDYRVGDVSRLPFEGETVDVISAMGLVGSLEAYAQKAFFREASRVLKDGGILITGYWGDNAQSAVIKLSWKNTLADMIVDTVSGKHQVSSHLNGHQMDDLMRELGLARTKYEFSWIPETTLLVYEKDHAKLAAQRSGYHPSRNI